MWLGGGPRARDLEGAEDALTSTFAMRSSKGCSVSAVATLVLVAEWSAVRAAAINQSESLLLEPRRLEARVVLCAGLPAATCGDNLITALAGIVHESSMLMLEGGIYAGHTFAISRSVMLQAQNARQAVLDGEGRREVMIINHGRVVMTGLNITNGFVTVSACMLNNTRRCSSTCLPKHGTPLQRPDCFTDIPCATLVHARRE